MVEEELSGGNMSRVTRLGDTVHRGTRPWTKQVHWLLEHLRAKGIQEVPAPLGYDEQGREVLKYIPGFVGNYPLPEQLLNALCDVVHGEKYLDPLIARKLMIKIQQSVTPARNNHLLTNREIDVLKCLAQGMSNREISLKLSITTRTVSTHVRNILNELELDNRTQVALYAFEHKIVKKSDLRKRH